MYLFVVVMADLQRCIEMSIVSSDSVLMDETLKHLSLKRSQSSLTPYDLEDTSYCNVSIQVSETIVFANYCVVANF